MDSNARELAINRIISGSQIITVAGRSYILKAPSRLQRYQAQEEYEKALHSLDFEGHFTRSSLKDALITLGLVPKDIDDKLKKLETDIDKLKHQLFQHHLDGHKAKSIRDALKSTRTLYSTLINNSHMLDHLTAEGYAESIRIYCLFSFCLYSNNTKHVEDTEIIHKCVIEASSDRLSNDQIREIAKNEPWRSTWNAFGKSAFLSSDYTEEQKALILYSQMYDAVYKAHEPPADYIIFDDDLLDGWMIHQRKENERERKTKKLDKRDKFDADEIYLFKDGNDKRPLNEFINETEDLNSLEAKIIKGQRKAALKIKGKLNESQLPDVKREIEMQANQQVMSRFRK